MPTLLDHLFAALLVVGVPGYAALFAWPRMRSALADGEAGDRIRAYWLNVALQWLLAAGGIAVWLQAERPLPALGLGLATGWRFWAAAAGALVVAIGLILQYAVVLRSAEGRRRARDELGRTALVVPRSAREMRHFAALAVTAGVCEEILYRGFLIWYVSAFTGTDAAGLTAAVLAAALAFAVGHLYQGPRNALRVGALAVVAGGLYVLAGSLWIVMVLHVVVDLAGGVTAMVVCREVATEAHEPVAPDSPG